MANKTERILAINQVIRFIEDAYALIDGEWPHSEAYKKEKDECIEILIQIKDKEFGKLP